MLKFHYLTVRADGGRDIYPLFSFPPRGIWQLKSPNPREFAIQVNKKWKCLGAAGIDWCITKYNDNNNSNDINNNKGKLMLFFYNQKILKAGDILR